jgi:DNA (cytosine-5)-methyltransferase 1
MKALDLFCGAGGASMGLKNAGFEVTGIDATSKPEYPFNFILKDATQIDIEFLKQFDFIWASPPCQLFTIASNLREAQGNKTNKLNLVPQTRVLLESSGVPYVMENVPKAPMRKDLMLCGSMFDLKVRRHRIFEMNFKIPQPKCDHKKQGKPVGVYHVMGDTCKGINRKTGKLVVGGSTAKTLEEGQAAMGINWMKWNTLKEAIPPKYSEYIAFEWLKIKK